jgi:hypothetical protein
MFVALRSIFRKRYPNDLACVIEKFRRRVYKGPCVATPSTATKTPVPKSLCVARFAPNELVRPTLESSAAGPSGNLYQVEMRWLSRKRKRRVDMIEVKVTPATKLTRRAPPAMLQRGNVGVLKVGLIAAYQARPIWPSIRPEGIRSFMYRDFFAER